MAISNDKKEPLPTKETASSKPNISNEQPQGYDAFLQAGKKLKENKEAIAKPTNLTSHLNTFRNEGRLAPTYSITQLLLEKPEPLTFFSVLGREGILVKGWTTMFSSYPKLGKTELIYQIACELASAGNIILIITEEPKLVWHVRIQRGETNGNNIGICFALGKKDIVEELIATTSASIIIIDTVRSVLGLENENDNSEISRVLAPIINAARANNKTLILLHHSRKGGGQNGEGITGGHAFLGIVDASIEIRPLDNKPRRRLLSGAARLFQMPELIYEMNDNGTLQIVGSPEDLKLESVQKNVLTILNDGWQSTAEIENQLTPSPSRSQLTDALQQLATDRKIDRQPLVSEGSRPGVTYKWKLKSSKGGETSD
ncbi:MAG: AAA family ATPase [bacterium]|nr:AAA family ATPase [bacterium]